MTVNSKIAWTTHTWNPWTGCTPVSEGCAHCYMERWAKRCGKDPRAVTRSSERVFRLPVSSRKVVAGDLVFVCSLSDFFHEDVPDEWRNEALGMMAFRHDVTFLLLTKRPKKMADYLGNVSWPEVGGALACELDRQPTKALRAELEQAVSWLHGEWCEDEAPRPPWSEMNHACAGLPNVWLGVTAENQTRAEERIPALLANEWPGRRFVSIEPMLGLVDLRRLMTPITGPGSSQPAAPPTWLRHDALDGYVGNEDWHGRGAGHLGGRQLDWVIVGGESGPHCRGLELAWTRLVRDQCLAAGVAFFMKQLGGWPDKREQLEDLPEDLRIRETPARGEIHEHLRTP